MRSFFAAIGDALRAVCSFLKSALSLPGRLLGGVFGGPLSGPPAGDSPLVEDLAEQVAAEDAKSRDNWSKIAAALWHWLMDGLIAKGPVAVPAWWPRGIQEWAPGLHAEEAEKLVSANENALESHLRGLYAVPGVRKVQPLPPVKEWASLEPTSVKPAPDWDPELTIPDPDCAPS